MCLCSYAFQCSMPQTQADPDPWALNSTKLQMVQVAPVSSRFAVTSGLSCASFFTLTTVCSVPSTLSVPGKEGDAQKTWFSFSCMHSQDREGGLMRYMQFFYTYTTQKYMSAGLYWFQWEGLITSSVKYQPTLVEV